MRAPGHPRHRTPQIGDRVRLRRHTSPTAIREGVGVVIDMSRHLKPTHVAVSLDDQPGNTETPWRRWTISDVIVVQSATSTGDRP